MTRLSVNINKVATLRNARGGNVPDLVQVAKDCERFGAEGITVHPRPDERHIRYADVLALKEVVTTEFNIEGYPNEKFLELVHQVKPDQVTLVPDPPGVLTSNAGWNTVEKKEFLKGVIGELKEGGMRVSIFLDTDISNVNGAAETGTDRIEFYTGPYAEEYPKNPGSAVEPYRKAALRATELGLGINAGHDLDTKNLRYFRQNVPNLLEVSIGHALICDALYWGLDNTIGIYKRELRK